MMVWFETILVSLTALTGLVWLLDKLFLAKRRAAAAGVTDTSAITAHHCTALLRVPGDAPTAVLPTRCSASDTPRHRSRASRVASAMAALAAGNPGAGTRFPASHVGARCVPRALHASSVVSVT